MLVKIVHHIVWYCVDIVNDSMCVSRTYSSFLLGLFVYVGVTVQEEFDAAANQAT